MPKSNANLIFVLILLTTIWNIECGKLSGPSLTILKKLEKCDSTEGLTVIMDKYRINKYNQTVYTYNGEINVLEELTDEGTEGPSLNVIKRIEKCNSTEGHKIIVDKYRINKYNQTVYTYNSEVNMLEELGDEGAEVNFMVDIWGNGGWRKNFLNKRFKKACSTLKQLSPNYVAAIFQQANITGCPIPKGTYVFKDLVINMDISVPLPYGLYRSTTEFLKDNKVFFCLIFVIDIVPKD